MPALGQRDPEKESFWRETFAAWRKSGEGKAEFCRRKGLKLNAFCSWEGRIRERDEELRKAKRRAQYEQRRAGRVGKAQPLFVPVESSAASESMNIETDARLVKTHIELLAPGSGIVIRLGHGFEQDALVRVLCALKEVEC